MPMQVQLVLKSNIHPATVRRIVRDAESIVDGLPLLTGHQIAHLRPALVATLARAAARQGAIVEAAARIGGGL